MERQEPCPGAEKGDPSLGETQDQVRAGGQSPCPLPSWAPMEEAEGKGWLAVNPPPSPLLPTVHQQAWQRKPARLGPLMMTLLGLPLVAQLVNNLPAMQETWVRSLGWKDPLEKGRASHSSIFAWEIPWTEEPDGLQSTGLQRVGHDWVTNPFSLQSSERDELQG